MVIYDCLKHNGYWKVCGGGVSIHCIVLHLDVLDLRQPWTLTRVLKQDSCRGSSVGDQFFYVCAWGWDWEVLYICCCLRRDRYPPSHGASHKISKWDWRPAVSSGYSSQIFCIAVSSSYTVCAATDYGQFMEWLCVFDILHNRLSN